MMQRYAFGSSLALRDKLDRCLELEDFLVEIKCDSSR